MVVAVAVAEATAVGEATSFDLAVLLRLVAPVEAEVSFLEVLALRLGVEMTSTEAVAFSAGFAKFATAAMSAGIVVEVECMGNMTDCDSSGKGGGASNTDASITDEFSA